MLSVNIQIFRLITGFSKSSRGRCLFETSEKQILNLKISFVPKSMGFQASLCGRPSEVRVTSIIQAYSNPLVKARQEARSIYLNSD